MPLVVKHAYTSPYPDAGNSKLLQPSHWNANHGLTGTADVNQGGTGLATLPAGQLLFGNGTTALAPTTNLFWDVTNTFLRVNGAPTNAANTDKLQVNGDANINGIRYGSNSIAQTSATGTPTSRSLFFSTANMAGQAGDISITGGNSTTLSGGLVSIAGGDGISSGGDLSFVGGTNTGAGSTGGYVGIFGGVGVDLGGYFNIIGGDATGAFGTGGNVEMLAGQASTGFGGNMTFQAGIGGEGGGSFTMAGGNGTVTGGAGGGFTAAGGTAFVAGQGGGAVNFSGGPSVNGTGGYCQFNGGDGSGAGEKGGFLAFYAGIGTSTAQGGEITFRPGTGTPNGEIFFKDAGNADRLKIVDSYVAFGAYTAGVVVQAGYVTIKDLAGNIRRLLVG